MQGSLKKFRFVRDSNPWALRYRFGDLPIELTTQLTEQVIELVRVNELRYPFQYLLWNLHIFD